MLHDTNPFDPSYLSGSSSSFNSPRLESLRNLFSSSYQVQASQDDAPPSLPEVDRQFEYIFMHIFFPPLLPPNDDYTVANDLALASAACGSAYNFAEYIDDRQRGIWATVPKMLEHLCKFVESNRLSDNIIMSQLDSMEVGDVIAYHLRVQNAAVMLRRREHDTIVESFEVIPHWQGDPFRDDALRKLSHSYPGPAIGVPNAIFDDGDFRSELVNFLVMMNHDIPHPQSEYITELLTGILRAVGTPAEIQRSQKYVDRHVRHIVRLSKDSSPSWRRSSLWLVIKVAIQTTLERCGLGLATYKSFMIFFMHELAQKALSRKEPNELLHVMSSRINCRLVKLSTMAPPWLSNLMLKACTGVRSVIETRWALVQAAQGILPQWKAPEPNPLKDIQLSIKHSREYALKASMVPNSHNSFPTFVPGHRQRSSLEEFLSWESFQFQSAHIAEPHITLYDVERQVQERLDDWATQITDIEDACRRLCRLACNYYQSARNTYSADTSNDDSEGLSRVFLTIIELWIVVDKIAVKQIPMLADYSPEISTAFLERLLIRTPESHWRLRLAYQYIRARQDHARPGWSIFSTKATEHHFAVRYYQNSSRMQSLLARIDEDAQRERHERITELHRKNSRHAELTEEEKNRNIQFEIEVHVWPLPTDPLLARIFVFELDCPVIVDCWRTIICLFLRRQYRSTCDHDILHSLLRMYQSRSCKESDVCVNLTIQEFSYYCRTTRSFVGINKSLEQPVSYRLPEGPYKNLQHYLEDTSHTSNDVLANQGECHQDLSIHEFIAFGHLRSGPLLQWLNILRELRARTLSLRRGEVHLLLAQASSQVGPLSEAGEWVWHQDLEDTSFCHILLGELESLVSDVEANWLEGIAMNTVSLLTSRVLVANRDGSVVRRAHILLRKIRLTTFSWVEALYKTPKEAVSQDWASESQRNLWQIAAVCRSTFDVGSVDTRMFLSSVEDLKICVTCAIIIRDNMPKDGSSDASYLLARDRHLSLALEPILGDVIENNSEGMNLAIKGVWPTFRPVSHWKRLGHANHRWIACTGEDSQKVIFNLLDGSLLVNGEKLHKLPPHITRYQNYRMLFGEQRRFSVTLADVPGMDFLVRDPISGHQVYFATRGKGLLIKARECGSPHILELISHKEPMQDLPNSLVRDHVHWLNPSTGTIEVRPIQKAWETSSQSWMMNLGTNVDDLKYATMRQGSRMFVDIHSPTWEMLSTFLNPPLCRFAPLRALLFRRRGRGPTVQKFFWNGL